MDPDLGLTAPQLLVEIPANLARLKAARPEDALRWRLATRAAFREYFSRGYVVTEAVRFPDERGTRVVYVLAQREAAP